MRSNKGFSLIEILIVISIIAILASIGVAQYQTYNLRVKIAQGMMVLDNIGDMAKAYYDMHGVFPNLQQIGLYYDSIDPTQSPMAANLDEYIASRVAYTFIIDQGTSYTCPTAAYGGYISNLSKNDYITMSQNGTLINVTELLVYVDHTFKNYCQYFYMQYNPADSSMTAVSGNFIPNCTNGSDDPNASNFFTDAGNQC